MVSLHRRRPGRTPTDRETIMRRAIPILAVVAGLGLAGCESRQQKVADDREDAIEAAAEQKSDALEKQADAAEAAGDEAREDALEKQADAVEAEGERQGDAVENAAR
jgi:hypothetical protein